MLDQEKEVLFLEVLEERNDVLIIMGKDGVEVLEKNPYNLLKYKYYHGKKIRFISNSEDKLSVEETIDDGIFLFTFHGITLNVADYKVKTAEAIFEAQSAGNLLPLLSLWKLKYFEKYLDISIVLEANSTLELTREGRLLLPKHVGLKILECQERSDGGRVVKVEFLRSVNSPLDRIFTHEIRMKKGQTRIDVNKLAVSLIGRDETGQLWMHVVPPEYRNRSISSCEMWLCGGEDEKDNFFDILT